jgi:nucleoside phosphorylase
MIFDATNGRPLIAARTHVVGQSHDMKIGIMGAMTEEISGIVEQIKTSGVTRVGSRDFIEGTWRGLDVVVVFSRWGKVAAAVTATILLQHFAVDGIFFVGVAGAVDPVLKSAISLLPPT